MNTTQIQDYASRIMEANRARDYARAAFLTKQVPAEQRRELDAACRAIGEEYAHANPRR